MVKKSTFIHSVVFTFILSAAASEETPVVAEGEAAPVEPSEAAPEEEPDNTLAYDDFVKQQKEKAAALAAKLGTPVQEDIPAAETSSTAEEPSPATAGARKGAKVDFVLSHLPIPLSPRL